jgi:hypothetical protein
MSTGRLIFEVVTTGIALGIGWYVLVCWDDW